MKYMQIELFSKTWNISHVFCVWDWRMVFLRHEQESHSIKEVYSTEGRNAKIQKDSKDNCIRDQP